MDILNLKPGNAVKLHDGVNGLVVINFELSLFATGFEQGGWDDEEGGLLVDGSGEGLIRYPKVVLQNNKTFYET